jgi:pheromone shutdown protein TraB
MIIILGVGHVFDIAEQVRHIIQEEHPDVVGVELDPGRYQALLNPGKNTDAQLTYRLLAAFQRRLARQYGGEVGSEMLAATRTAQEIGSEVLFIDADAGQLFGRLWKEMPMREKLKLGLSALTSLFLSRKKVEKELETFQSNESIYLEEMGVQFPTLKRMLIDERNEIMAKRIDQAASRYPIVLAVIGDGHVEGIVRLLGRDDIKVYRLKEIRGQASREEEGVARQGNAQANFHFERSLQ